MELPYFSSKVPLKDFRRLALIHRQEMEAARQTVAQACAMFTQGQRAESERYDLIIQSVQALKETYQRFASILHMTTILPNSVYSLRYSHIQVLRNIDNQVNNLILQLLIFRDISSSPSITVNMQQGKIQRDLEMLLEDSDDSVMNIRLLLDQASFIER